MKKLFAALSLAVAWYIAAGALSGQVPTPTVNGNPNGATQSLYFYTGGGDVEYVCEANSTTALTQLPTVSGGTAANPVVLTSTAHGIHYTSTEVMNAVVYISGGTGDWAGINGAQRVTPTSANAFSIAVNGSGYAAFGSQALTVSTRAPRVTLPVWRVQRRQYSAAGKLSTIGWAVSTTAADANNLAGGNSGFNSICANRATLAYQ